MGRQVYDIDNTIDLKANRQQAALGYFFAKTYGLMFLALLLTALVGLGVFVTPGLSSILLGHGWTFFVLFALEIGTVVWLSRSMSKLSASTAVLGFFFYAALNGLTLSVIFFAYTATSIVQTFMVSAGMFLGLALTGTLIKRDLNAMGTFFSAGIWGLLILGLGNMFFHSSALDTALSLAGVLIFSGLAAYDAQKVKRLAHYSLGTSAVEGMRLSVMAALTLYLDFINLFLYLLRLMGRRK